MKNPFKALAVAGLAAVAVAAITPDANAQGQPKKKEDEAVRMPSPRKSEDPPTLWAYFAVAIILGSIFVANMIPSKRGHQD